MAYQGSYEEHASHGSVEDVSAWALGFAMFASMMMVLLGTFHLITGIAAIIDDEFYVLRPNFALELDVSTWGWIHTFAGLGIILAGIGLLTGNVIARVVTVFIALMSVIWNFYSIAYYPVWSIMMIAFGIAVIWALTAHGRDMEVFKEE